MKFWKKSMAWMMTLCLLVGMMGGFFMQAATPLTLDVAEKTGEKTVKLYFSATATVAANTTAYLYIADNATSKTAIVHNEVALSWSGTLSGNTWTMTGSVAVDNTDVDTIAEVEALVSNTGLYAGKTVVFALYETAGTKGNSLIDSVSAGSTKLSATVAAAADAFDGVIIALSEPFTLKNVYQYNDTHMMLEFSEAFTKTSGYEAWVRIVDADHKLQKIGGTNQQGKVVWSGINGAYYGKQNTEYAYRMYGTLCHDQSAGALKNKTLTQIQAIVDEHNAVAGNEKWYIEFCLRESSGTAGNGTLTQFVSLEGKRQLVANVPGAPGVEVDCCYVRITPVTEAVKVTSATVTGPHSLQVTFSEPISNSMFVSPSLAAPYYGVRIVNANNALQQHNGKNMQWGGSFTATADPKVYNFTITDSTRAGDIGFTDLHAIADLAAQKNLKLTFCIEQNSGGFGDVLQHVDNITSLDGVRKLEVSAPSTNGNYTTITGLPQNPQELKLVSAVAINDTQIVATFNQPANITGSPLWFVSIVKANDVLVSRGSTPLQWGGNFEWYNDEHTQVLWTMAVNNTLSIKNLADLLTWTGLEQEKAAGYTMKFGVCEQTTGLACRSTKNLLVDNYWAQDGFALLTGTTKDTAGNNRAYTEITLADDYDTAPLTVTSVKQLDESELEVTFSAPVEISSKATFFICMVDGNDNVVENPKMRWGCTWKYADEKQDRIIATMLRSDNNNLGLRNLSELLSYKNMDNYKQYGYKFSIVEGASGSELGNGIVRDVMTRGGTKALDATKVAAGANDRIYAPIEWMDYDPSPVTLDKAELINDTQIEMTFSEPIAITGAPYAFLRLVDANYNVITLNGTPVQFGGTFRFHATDRSKLIYTLNVSKANITLDNSLIDILQFKNEKLESFKSGGYSWQVCVAEQKADGVTILTNNLVDNVKALDRNKKLAATVSKNGAAEPAYALVEYTEMPEEKLKVVSVKAISDKTAIITFDAPVEITGNPWMAMGLVDENNNLIYKTPDGKPTTVTTGNTSMQWGGTWKWNNEEHTQILWTIARKNHTGVLNLTDLFNYKGLDAFKDYKIKFRIEEAGADIGRNDSHISNITLAEDPRIHLEANFVMAADRAWSDVEVAYETKHIVSLARIVNDMQVMITFSEPVKIEGTPFIAMRFVKNGKLMWDGAPDVSFAMQFTGTWKWADKAQTKMLWTMSGGNRYGANNLYEVYNYCNGLTKFEGAEIAMCIEEAAPAGIGTTGILENISSLDGTRHLAGTEPTGNDKVFMKPAGSVSKDLIRVEKVEAIDNMTMEITYSGPIVFAEGDKEPSMAIRYLTATGDTHVVSDGRSAVFYGTWKWKEGTDNVMVWTLDTNRSRGAKNLDDIFLFRGNFKFNNDAEIMFCIMDPESKDNVSFSNRVNGVTNPEGTVHLMATKISQYGISVNPIDIQYDLPETESAVTEPIPEADIRPDYGWMLMIGGGVVVASLVVMIVLVAGKKKNEE